MISISKIDFMDSIKDNLQIKWDENALVIENSPYFKHLNSAELNECRTVSFVKTFTQNEYVFGMYNFVCTLSVCCFDKIFLEVLLSSILIESHQVCAL